MKIDLDRVGKRYQANWIFKNIDYTFESGKTYALLGKNGSGKSTLLRIIAGIQLPTKGKVLYTNVDAPLPAENFFQHIAYCAPEMELIEEFTLDEYLRFHFKFKPALGNYTAADIIQRLGMEPQANRFLHDFSSGMKQRIKLAQAFFSDTAVLLLDEPCSNLDQAGIDLYRNWLAELGRDRLILLASNDEREYTGSDHLLQVQDYSPEPNA